MNNKLSTITNLFEGKEIRSIWNSKKEEYYFSVVDVIAALTDANIPRNYWSDLKHRLVDTFYGNFRSFTLYTVVCESFDFSNPYKDTKKQLNKITNIRFLLGTE